MEFNQEAWLKYYIDMKSKLRTKAKTDFWERFLKVDKQFNFLNDYRKCKKTMRYNSFRHKLPYNKMVLREFPDNRNEE